MAISCWQRGELLRSLRSIVLDCSVPVSAQLIKAHKCSELMGDVGRRGHLAIPKCGHPEGHLAGWCPGSGYLWMEHHMDGMLSAADSSSFITTEQQTSGGRVINFALPLSEISAINHLKLPARDIRQRPHDKSLLHSVPPLMAHIMVWAHCMFSFFFKQKNKTKRKNDGQASRVTETASGD